MFHTPEFNILNLGTAENLVSACVHIIGKPVNYWMGRTVEAADKNDLSKVQPQILSGIKPADKRPAIAIGEPILPASSGSGSNSSCVTPSYTGQLDGTLSGKGVITFPDATSYCGQITDGQADGYGTMVYANGVIEDGCFENGQLQEGTRMKSMSDGYHMQESIFSGVVTNTSSYHSGASGSLTVECTHEEENKIFSVIYESETEIITLNSKVGLDGTIESISIDNDGEQIDGTWTDLDRTWRQQKSDELSISELALHALQQAFTRELTAHDLYIDLDISKEAPHPICDQIEKDGLFFTGAFENRDSIIGNGTILYPDGTRFFGSFYEGTPMRGCTALNNGYTFDGSPIRKQVKDHSIARIPRHTPGMNLAENLESIEETYNGEVMGNNLHGQGNLRTQSRLYFYEGGFKLGEFDGQGFLGWTEGSYEGSFRDGKYHGEGRLESSEGVYAGHFRDNEYHGPGELVINGQSFVGHFQNGVRVGLFEEMTLEGEVFQLTYNELGELQKRLPVKEATEQHDELEQIKAYKAIKSERKEATDARALDEGSGSSSRDRRGVTFSGEHDIRYENVDASGSIRSISDAKMQIPVEGGPVRAESSYHHDDIEGVINYSPEIQYSGAIRRGVPYGANGTLTWNNGSYSGPFAKGKFSGQGTLTFEGVEYQGTFYFYRDDKIELAGLQTDDDKVYELTLCPRTGICLELNHMSEE